MLNSDICGCCLFNIRKLPCHRESRGYVEHWMCNLNANGDFNFDLQADALGWNETSQRGSLKILRRVCVPKWRGISLSLCATSGTTRTMTRAAARIQSSRNVPGEWRALIVHCSPATLECFALGYPLLYELTNICVYVCIYETSAREE